jgi:hypothetical protein
VRRRRQAWWRRGLAALALVNGVAFAAETSGAAEKSGLESARRDYEALKAANARAPEQKVAPHSMLPVLEAAPPMAETLLPQRKKKHGDASADGRGEREKSANWLLEAMRDETDDEATAAEKSLEKMLDPSRAAEDDASRGDLVETARALEKQASAARKAREERRSAVERQRETKTVNPLNEFMASWMTPKDLELLGAGSTGSGTPRTEVELGGISGRPELSGVEGTSSGFVFSDRFVARAAPALPSEERSNPYLANLSPGSLDAPSLRPSEVVAPSLQPAPVVSVETRETSAPPPARTPLSESFRGKDDAKYFKQLKRF